MQTRYIWLSVIAVLLAFAGGFLLANSLNRAELERLRAENESIKTSGGAPGTPGSTQKLSPDEIRAAVAEADAKASNFQTQKAIGLALYRYGAIERDSEVLKEAARLLERAAELDPKDVDVLIGAGNANFDYAYFNKLNEPFAVARKYYERALAQDPQNAEAHTEIGLTYFLQDPPDDTKAIENFRRSLALNGKYERGLEFMIQALARAGRKDEAQKYLDQLRQVNPQSSSLQGLADQVANSGK
ncbi:MAG: tetratricopeptide repeat protein [Pyrinomonadaceae bacterium]